MWVGGSPSVLQKPLNLASSQKGLWDGSVRIQGHQSAQGTPSLGFPSLRALCRFLPQECVIINYFLVSSQCERPENTSKRQTRPSQMLMRVGGNIFLAIWSPQGLENTFMPKPHRHLKKAQSP